MRYFAMLLGIAMLLQVTPVEAQETCSFVLGFKALHDLIPEVVESCLEDHRISSADKTRYAKGRDAKEVLAGLLHPFLGTLHYESA